MTKQKILKELEGEEIWTNRFGERRCVIISEGRVITGGKVLKVSKEQLEGLLEDFLRQELGSAKARLEEIKEIVAH